MSKTKDEKENLGEVTGKGSESEVNTGDSISEVKGDESTSEVKTGDGDQITESTEDPPIEEKDTGDGTTDESNEYSENLVDENVKNALINVFGLNEDQVFDIYATALDFEAFKAKATEFGIADENLVEVFTLIGGVLDTDKNAATEDSIKEPAVEDHDDSIIEQTENIPDENKPSSETITFVKNVSGSQINIKYDFDKKSWVIGKGCTLPWNDIPVEVRRSQTFRNNLVNKNLLSGSLKDIYKK